VPENFYFHYDNGSGCQADYGTTVTHCRYCAGQEGCADPPICAQRMRNATSFITSTSINPAMGNYGNPAYSAALASYDSGRLAADPATGDAYDGIHYDVSWIGDEWQLGGPLSGPKAEPCEAPTRQDKVVGFLGALSTIRRDIPGKILEINMQEWDTFLHDVIGRALGGLTWEDWPETAAETDYVDLVSMDVFAVLPYGVLPLASDRALTSPDWIQLEDYFLEQIGKGKATTVAIDVMNMPNSEVELQMRTYGLASFLLWKDANSSWMAFPWKYTFSGLPGVQAPKPLGITWLTPESLIALGRPLESAGADIASLYRARGQSWGSCSSSQTDCAGAQVSLFSWAGAYGRRFERGFVAVNPEPWLSATIRFPSSSRYRYVVSFTGYDYLQTDGDWYKPHDCYYQGAPASTIQVPARSAVIVLDSGARVDCP
jgi:hypothetical protein